MIVGCQALTPLQHAITTGKVDFFQRLAAHPIADVKLVTPMLKVHALHFAVAQLRLDLMDIIGLPLSTADTTALGHTLLHVFCMPLDDSHVQRFAPKVRQSIHDIRTLDLHREPWWADIFESYFAEIKKTDEPDTDGPGDSTPPSFGRRVVPLEQRTEGSPEDHLRPVPSTDDFLRQLEAIQRLVVELGPAEILKVDVYDNSVLHYLASSRIVNDEAVRWLRQQENGDEIWQTSRNRWGWTPTDLWADNVTTIEPGHRSRRDPATRGRYPYTISRGR